MALAGNTRPECDDPTDGVAEIYMVAGCAHCVAAREDLEWRGTPYVEHDVEYDDAARARMLRLTGGVETVPVIVETGRPVRIGWMGQGCVV
jgi:glutaredoxin 3